jgi:hypothetical protein
MSPNTPSSPKHILAAVGSQNHFWPLLSLGYALAKHRQCQFRVIYVNQSGQSPDWLRIPSAYDDLEIAKTNIPPLTTMRPPARNAGEQFVGILMQIIGGRAAEDLQ